MDCVRMAKVNEKCRGKVVKEVIDDDGHMDSFLNVVFTDGSKLRIHYDWIYDLYYEPPEK